jgi:hypothetical protein
MAQHFKFDCRPLSLGLTCSCLGQTTAAGIVTLCGSQGREQNQRSRSYEYKSFWQPERLSGHSNCKKEVDTWAVFYVIGNGCLKLSF